MISIFVHILQDSSHPKAKEDVNLLNIASTFLGTLVPADGPCRYARFMAQMSANFERIARTVLERNERASKDESESNRVTSMTTTTFMPRSNNETSPSSLAQPSQGSTYATSPEYSAGPSVDVPHTGGLPHTNSSNTSIDNEFLPDAYQGMTAADLANATTSPNYTTTTNTAAAAASSLSRIYNTNDNLFPSTTGTPTNDVFPFSGFETNIIPPPPSLWQIPLTADWEFGNQFLEGIFADTNTTTNPYPLDFPAPPLSHPPQSYPPASGLNPTTNPTSTTTTATPPPTPTLDNLSIMGYDYGHQGQDQHMAHAQAQARARAQAQAQARVQEKMAETNTAFFGGFLDSY